MSTVEKLSRSIKIVDLPLGYDEKDILTNLEKVGKIVDIIKGSNEMIITYATTLEKELSTMYNGCPVNGNYSIIIQDPTSFDLNSADNDNLKVPSDIANQQSSRKGSRQGTAQKSPRDEYNPQVSPLEQNFYKAGENVNAFSPAKYETNASYSSGSKIGHAETAKSSGMFKSSEGTGQHQQNLLNRFNEMNMPSRQAQEKNDPANLVMSKLFVLAFTAVWSFTWFTYSLCS